MKFKLLKHKGILFAVCTMLLITGCGSSSSGTDSSSSETTESSAADLTMKEYTSKDGTLSISLPGENWELDEDSSDLYVFSSDKGLVMISHSANASDELYPESEDNLGMILEIEGYSSENYEVDDFQRMQTNSVKSFDALIHYTEDSAMYSSGILHGVLSDDDVYMASAMLKDSDESMISALQDSLKNYVWEEQEDSSTKKSKKSKKTTATPTPETTKEASQEEAEATAEPTAEATAEPTAEATAEPTAEATAEPTAEATPEATAVVTQVPESEITAVNRSGYCHSAAYVRDAPDSGSNIIGSVAEGDTLTITGEIRNWYRISYQGQTAYVCKDYVK